MTRIAYLNLRGPHDSERARIFTEGLSRCGFKVLPCLTMKPDDTDILVTWNRIGDGDMAARAFESMGRPVLVAENALWGNIFAGEKWYALGRNFHNLSGAAPFRGADRFESLGVALEHEKLWGKQSLILMQRGIGPAETRQPIYWRERVRSENPTAAVREHPGMRKDVPSLASVLKDFGDIITWASAGAITALVQGHRVHAGMPGWIGLMRPTDYEQERQSMFRRLAWAQARHSEIESGEAFARLLP